MYKTHMGPHGGIRIPEPVQQEAGIPAKAEVYVRVLAPGVIVIETEKAVTDLIRQCSGPAELAGLLDRLRRGF